MPRPLHSGTTVEHLRKDAKRWLKALRANDPAARERLRAAWPDAPAQPGLREIQYALAREHGFAGWAALKDGVAAAATGASPRDQALRRLLRAADRGDVVELTTVLDAHPDLINERGTLEGHTGRRTALHFGVHHVEVVRALVERGADPNIRDEGDHAFPLHFAAERGDPGVVRLLVEHGAETVAGEVDDHQLDIIGWATCFPDTVIRRDLVDYLLAHGARHTLHSAVAVGDLEAIRTCARQDPDAIERPMDRVNRRRHALHLAVVKNRLDSATVLLELGANPDAQDAGGMTPLDEAVLRGARDIAEALLAAGATMTLPAAVALARGAEVERLLRDDPDALKPGHRWGTLIVKAAATASGAIIEALVRHGASVDAVDDEATSVDGTSGYTALHAAAFHGNLEAVDALLKHGANPFARDGRYDGTPAGWARYAGRGQVAERLTAVETRRELTHGGHLATTREGRLDAFLRMACLDWRVGGSERRHQTAAAGRLLARHPELARDAAIVCGGVAQVQRLLDEQPQLVNQALGPRQWPPLLYVCSARLPGNDAWSGNAVEMARLLLDRGADPNASYAGGDESIRYTALACVIGRGEEQASTHPRARELAALLLDRGAEPYDMQVLYNAFGGHASFPLLADDDLVWLLELIYQASLKRGRQSDWLDPDWTMLSMGAYGPGAGYLLHAALKGNHLPIAKWALSHGASPNPPRVSDPRTPAASLHDLARQMGLTDFAELLARHGAIARVMPAPPADPVDIEARLFAAAEHDRVDAAARLLDNGLSPNVERQDGARPMHVAAYAGSLRVLKLLLDRGADVDPRDRAHGTTPIYWAFFGQRWAAVDLLTPHSRDVWTLVPAARLRRLEEVLAADTRLAKVSWRQGTPLFYLPDDENAAAQIVELFLSHGADASFRREDGATAERIARARGLDRAADLLRSSPWPRR